jgi:hypothetical protein
MQFYPKKFAKRIMPIIPENRKTASAIIKVQQHSVLTYIFARFNLSNASIAADSKVSLSVTK